VIRTAATGLALTALVTGLAGVGFGRAAVGPAIGFGLLATLVQMGAGRALAAARGGSSADLLKGYGIGMGLRALSLVVLLVALVAGRDWLEPLPTALGFLGVLIPLLFLEVRRAR